MGWVPGAPSHSWHPSTLLHTAILRLGGGGGVPTQSFTLSAFKPLPHSSRKRGLLSTCRLPWLCPPQLPRFGAREARSAPAPPTQDLDMRLTFITLCVFQAEAGLVPLSHLGAVGCQKVVMGEDVHAVVVPGGYRTCWGGGERARQSPPARVGGMPAFVQEEVQSWGGGKSVLEKWIKGSPPEGLGRRAKTPPPPLCVQQLPLTRGIRARPRSGALPWGGSRHARGCESGRRSAGGAGAHKASWHCGHYWTSSSLLQHNRACAVGGPQCMLSLGLAGHGAASPRQLRRKTGVRLPQSSSHLGPEEDSWQQPSVPGL